MIPSRFQILGHTITVKVDAKTCEAAGADGLYQHEEKTILLKSKKGGHYEATFFHELFHCIFEHTGMPELSKDEELVDRLGEALYQIVSSFAGQKG